MERRREQRLTPKTKLFLLHPAKRCVQKERRERGRRETETDTKREREEEKKREGKREGSREWGGRERERRGWEGAQAFSKVTYRRFSSAGS